MPPVTTTTAEFNLQEEIVQLRKDVTAMKRYFVITTWITIIMVVLPLVAAIVFIPKAISSFSSTLVIPEGY